MKRKLIILTVTVMTLVLIFCGCGGAEEEEPEKKGLENGYKSGANDELPRDLCAYRSEVNVFPVNDVTLYYSFGWLYSIYPPEEREYVDERFFNHTELLTIPEELFVGKKGNIAFSLKANDKHFSGYGGNVYYYRTGDVVFCRKLR